MWTVIAADPTSEASAEVYPELLEAVRNEGYVDEVVQAIVSSNGAMTLMNGYLDGEPALSRLAKRLVRAESAKRLLTPSVLDMFVSALRSEGGSPERGARALLLLGELIASQGEEGASERLWTSGDHGRNLLPVLRDFVGAHVVNPRVLSDYLWLLTNLMMSEAPVARRAPRAAACLEGVFTDLLARPFAEALIAPPHVGRGFGRRPTEAGREDGTNAILYLSLLAEDISRNGDDGDETVLSGADKAWWAAHLLETGAVGAMGRFAGAIATADPNSEAFNDENTKSFVRITTFVAGWLVDTLTAAEGGHDSAKRVAEAFVSGGGMAVSLWATGDGSEAATMAQRLCEKLIAPVFHLSVEEQRGRYEDFIAQDSVM